MPQRFQARQWVPFPVELVFAFFANPSNLPHLMPPRQKARIEDLRLQPPPSRPISPDPARRFLSVAAGVGTEVLISFLPIAWVPKRMSWMARITEFAWNSHFCDEQIRGPFTSFRHRHGIEPEVRNGVEGTLVSDEVEFALHYGILGMSASVLVRHQLKSAFNYRHLRLPEILAAAARQATRRT